MGRVDMFVEGRGGVGVMGTVSCLLETGGTSDTRELLVVEDDSQLKATI